MFSAVQLDVTISIHQVVSHLGNTHIVLEAPMVSMYRQLPKEHPIHALFAPHVEGTALINWGADEVGIQSVQRLGLVFQEQQQHSRNTALSELCRTFSMQPVFLLDSAVSSVVWIAVNPPVV